MPKFLKFLHIALFPADYLHQAYCYQGEDGSAWLTVELLIDGKIVSIDLPATQLSWYRAIWRAVSI